MHAQEGKTLDKLAAQRDKLAALDEEVAKITRDFAQHAEAQSNALQQERHRQHSKMAERRARARARRKKSGRVDAGSKAPDASSTGRGAGTVSSAAMRSLAQELETALTRSKQRLAVGKSYEDQTRSLIQDLSMILEHVSLASTAAKAAPSRITAPSVSIGAPRLTLGVGPPATGPGGGGGASKTRPPALP